MRAGAMRGWHDLYLKALELENFKSFGRRVEIPFGRGYTGVTGPNGSGKSNVSDAILFVLGPKSNRVIRAGKLTDLIFNGGREGKPATYCSASLIFDNSDRALPIDAEDVKLTRLIRLSQGEAGYNSYFYINGHKASLTEFDGLLLYSNISADGYNIVQQGDVARLVSMTPLERRRILEQVAGIGRYDDDIQKAEGERTKVEENLQRLGIILGEIKHHLSSLEKDRAGALRYKELKARLDKAKGQMAYQQRESVMRQLGSVGAQVAKHEDERRRLEGEKVLLAERLAAAQAKLEELEGKLEAAAGPEARQLKERVDHLRIERARTGDGLQAARDGLKAGKTEEAQVARDVASLAKEAQRLEAQVVQLDKELGDVDAELQRVTVTVAKLEADASRSDSRVEVLQTSIAKATHEMEQGRAEHHALAVEEGKVRQVAEVLEAEVARLEEGRKELLFEVQDADWNLRELKGAAKSSSGSLTRLQSEFHTLRNEEGELEAKAATLEPEVKRLAREYERLRAEANASRGPHSGVEAMLEARDTNQVKGIHGTIEGLGTMEGKYEVALQVAAGSRLQALVVDDDGVAQEAITILKEGKLGRAIFLPLSKMLPAHPRGKALMVAREAIGFAIDLVKFDERYRGAFWYVFGDTLVVKDLSEARRLMGGVRLVTLDGQLVEASGAIIGGSPDAIRGPRAGSKGELDRVGAALRAATEESEEVARRRAELRARLAKVDAELRELAGASEVGRSKADLIEVRAKEAKAKLARVEEDLGTAKVRWEEAGRRLPGVQRQREALEERLGTLAKELEGMRTEVTRAAPREVAQALKAAQRERSEALERTGALRTNLQGGQAQSELVKARSADALERQRALEERRQLLVTKEAELSTYLVGVEEELKTLAKVEEGLMAHHQRLRKGRDEAFQARAQADADLDRLQSRMESRQDLLTGLRSEVKVQESALAVAEEELARYAVDTSEEMPSLEKLRSLQVKLQADLEALGAVNLRALEEFEIQTLRHKELSAEVERLQGERRDLMKLVEELNARKRQGLLEVFKAINENFWAAYAELSEGGEAELELEDPKDPFQGGLIMRVKPPNKKSLRLEALSGGEKGLVSMAFIFALQRYDPSPFYLLDEVDHNLDAVNAEKVARTVRRNSSRAQFIQVSLRRITLKEADHLLGVTMGPRGQSEVILKLDIGGVQEEATETEGVEA